MNRIKALLHQAALTRNVVNAAMNDITHEQSLTAPANGGNCMNWVLGHLISIQDGALSLLGQEPVLPAEARQRYARGAPPIADPADALPVDELVEAWEQSSLRFADGLRGMPERRLDRPVPNNSTGNPEETVASLLLTTLFHQAYHAGQLAMLRRMAGLSRVVG